MPETSVPNLPGGVSDRPATPFRFSPARSHGPVVEHRVCHEKTRFLFHVLWGRWSSFPKPSGPGILAASPRESARRRVGCRIVSTPPGLLANTTRRGPRFRPARKACPEPRCAGLPGPSRKSEPSAPRSTDPTGRAQTPAGRAPACPGKLEAVFSFFPATFRGTGVGGRRMRPPRSSGGGEPAPARA